MADDQERDGGEQGSDKVKRECLQTRTNRLLSLSLSPVSKTHRSSLQEIVEIRERFEEEAGEEGDIFDKTVENRINLERVRSLEGKLREGLEAVDRTAAEVKGDVERLRDVHAEVAGKFNEAKEAKDFEKERKRQGG